MSGHYFQQDDEPFAYMNFGTEATPVWTLMPNAEEIRCNLTKGKSERKPRSTPFTLKRGGRKEAPISMKYNRARVDDPVYNKLYDSFANDTPVQFAITDIAITESAAKGFKAWCEVFEIPLVAGSGEEGVIHEINAEPTDYMEADALVLPTLIGAS